MVSNAREDFPDPDGPVMTVKARRGISRSNPLRLCCLAPRILIESFTRESYCPAPALGGQRGGSVGEKKALRSARTGGIHVTRSRGAQHLSAAERRSCSATAPRYFRATGTATASWLCDCASRRDRSTAAQRRRRPRAECSTARSH